MARLIAISPTRLFILAMVVGTIATGATSLCSLLAKELAWPPWYPAVTGLLWTLAAATLLVMDAHKPAHIATTTPARSSRK